MAKDKDPIEKEKTAKKYSGAYHIPENEEENYKLLRKIICGRINKNLDGKAMMYFSGERKIYNVKKKKISIGNKDTLRRLVEKKKAQGYERYGEEDSQGLFYGTRFSISEFTTRGQHTIQVADIAGQIAQGLELDPKSVQLVELSALGHDYGHSLFAHTGEDALTAFLQRHEEGDLKDIRFSHVLHSRIALLKDVRRKGCEVNELSQNAIEAHSSSPYAETPYSLVAEIVLYADKAASAISDIRDMIKAGRINFETDFHNKETRKNVREVLKEYDEFNKLNEEEKIEMVDKAIEETKMFYKQPTQQQKAVMIAGVVNQTISTAHERLEEEKAKGPAEIDYQYQSFFERSKVVKCILKVGKGMLTEKENTNDLGKAGKETEALIEEITEYVYQHKERFEKEEPFSKWKIDNIEYNNEKEFPWTRQVAYGMAEFTDLQFIEFAKGLLVDKELCKTLSTCKVLKKDTENVETHDFSTADKIENIMKVEKGVNKTRIEADIDR